MGELTPEELLQEARRSLQAPTTRGWRGVTHQDLDEAMRQLHAPLADTPGRDRRPGPMAASSEPLPPDISENIPPKPGSAVLKLIKGGKRTE